ncbi:hypothetical protein [Myroides odoratimimus]|uniref:hypothetical protein n=1 Tax=Myroides odoratimimus TaxID=76832 RepID=UPI0025786092|nr:hypothetical protein [Myroides odoratimimus]MDM1454713.1 hypothetical protein [Myroides odoratimimus]MDM1478451.1 hypothetical protein [Myroides odoratimimus]MDM1490713.1 hypothetical protein [Myroides odoratimimus]
MENNLAQHLKGYTLNRDGTGYFDSYDNTEEWVDGQIVRTSIVTRVLTEATILSLKTIIDQPDYHDTLWKEFVTSHLLDELRKECENKEFTSEQAFQQLRIVDIAYGFYKEPVDFFVYLITENVHADHGVVLLCDKDRFPIKTHCE